MGIKRIIIPQISVEDRKKGLTDINLAKYTSSTSSAHFEAFLTEYAIIYIISGEKELILSGNTYHFGKGELFLLPKGEYIMSEYVTAGNNFESLTLFFNTRISQKVLSEIEINSIPIHNKKRNLGDRDICTIPVTSDIKNIYLSLISYIEKDITFKQELIQLKFMELLFLLLDAAADKIIHFLSSAVQRDKPDIPTIVSEYLYTSITLDKLAMLTGRSISQFKRDFIRLYNMAPHQWLVKKKLEHAAFLLKTTSKNIDEIAEDSGFVNSTHFARIFKREYGVSPSKFVTK